MLRAEGDGVRRGGGDWDKGELINGDPRKDDAPAWKEPPEECART